MSLLYVESSAGPVEVYEATITRPLTGVWHADLDVDSSTPLSGTATIGVSEGALQLVGTVTAGAIVAERQRVRIVGGRAGLAKTVRPHAYSRAQLRLHLTDLLTSVGERLAASSDPGVLATILPRWTRMGGLASHALDQLVAHIPNAMWRMTASGAVWVGRNAWPPATLDYVLVEDDTAARRMVMTSEDPTLTAGVLLDGRQVRHVVHRFTSAGVRSEVLYS